MNALRALLPAPAASIGLAVFWLVLVGALSAGQMVLAALLGVLVPIATRRFRATRPPVRRLGAALQLVGVFTCDLVVANLSVAGAVLGGMARVQPRFARVPLDI